MENQLKMANEIQYSLQLCLCSAFLNKTLEAKWFAHNLVNRIEKLNVISLYPPCVLRLNSGCSFGSFQ